MPTHDIELASRSGCPEVVDNINCCVRTYCDRFLIECISVNWMDDNFHLVGSTDDSLVAQIEMCYIDNMYRQQKGSYSVNQFWYIFVSSVLHNKCKDLYLDM